jgi:hypothetical protein
VGDRRLIELARRAIEAERDVEDVDDLATGPEDYGRILAADRAAREAVDAAIRAAMGPGSAAVLLPDGTLVVRCEDVDGVAILPPDRVRPLAPAAPAGVDLGLVREVCGAIARYRGPGLGYPVHVLDGRWGTLDVEAPDRWIATGSDGTIVVPGAAIV